MYRGDEMKIKTVKDLKLELVKAEKTAKWLAGELGYSTSYMYQCIAFKKEKEIKRMEKILNEVE